MTVLQEDFNLLAFVVLVLAKIHFVKNAKKSCLAIIQSWNRWLLELRKKVENESTDEKSSDSNEN